MGQLRDSQQWKDTANPKLEKQKEGDDMTRA